MNFGEALEQLKAGNRVQRAGWNGRGMWLAYFNPGDELAWYASGPWLPFIVMKTVGGEIVPWLASQTDILAEDWRAVECE